MSNYSELLRDPHWLEKSNHIRLLNNHRCEECGASEVQLNIHHCWYETNHMPWEYPDYCFRCLCVECHKKREAAELTLKMFMARIGYSEFKIILRVMMNYIEMGKK